MSGGNARERKKFSSAVEREVDRRVSLGTQGPAFHAPPMKLLEKRKSRRQLAVDVCGLVGMGFLWWDLIEPQANPFQVFVSFPMLGLLVFCLWSFVNDVVKRRRTKIGLLLAVCVPLTLIGTGRSYDRLYRPNFVYGALYVPLGKVYDHRGPYQLALNVALPADIKNVGVSVIDVSGLHNGSDATKALLSAWHGYIPDVYAGVGAVTNANLSCDGEKEYVLDLSTEVGPFHEELKCTNNDLNSQTMTVSKWLVANSDFQDLVKGWKPVNEKPIKPTLLVRLLDFCE